jgi:hypothetical protein
LYISRISEIIFDERKVRECSTEFIIPRADKEAHRRPRLDIVRAEAEDSTRLSNVDKALEQCNEVRKFQPTEPQMFHDPILF